MWAIWHGVWHTRYAIVLVLVMFLAYINLIFGVKFTGAQNNAWMASIGIGCVSSRSRLP